MAKKPRDESAADPTQPEKKALPSILERIFEVRAKLFKSELSEVFVIHRKFEAFSIHKLAREIERACSDHGLVVEYQVLKWHKGGNLTIVEGRMDIICVETGAVRSYFAIGEGADGGDKGVGKAVSYFRKQAMIQAFNLAIGIDNEAENEQAADVPNMTGQPTANAAPPDQLPIKHLNGAVETVTRDYYGSTMIGLILSIHDPDALDWFEAANEQAVSASTTHSSIIKEAFRSRKSQLRPASDAA